MGWNTYFFLYIYSWHPIPPHGTPLKYPLCPVPSHHNLTTICSGTGGVPRNAFDLGELPLLGAQRAHALGLEPPLDTVQVEHVPAVGEGDGKAILVGGWRWCLILYGRLVQRVTANSTRVCTDIPGPHGDCVPFFMGSSECGGCSEWVRGAQREEEENENFRETRSERNVGKRSDNLTHEHKWPQQPHVDSTIRALSLATH